MTALVPYQQQSSLELAGSAWQLAEKIARTEFVPAALRGKPEAVLACILTGHEAGVSPMQALAKIHVIEGRPAMSAELMRALVFAAGHEINVDELTTTRAVVSGRRAGSDRVTRIEWTMEDAKRAQLDGKQNWRKTPRAMLIARATSELCRTIFPDVLAGISYTPEELEDGVLDEVDPVAATAAPPKRATAKAKRAATTAAAPVDAELVPAPVGEVPDLPDPPSAGAPSDDDGEIVDAEIVEDGEPWTPGEWESANWGDPAPEPQQRATLTGPQAIAVRMSEVFGIRGSGEQVRAARLALIAAILGIPTPATSKDLTPEQLGTVLRTLNDWPDDRSITVTAADGSRVLVKPVNFPADDPDAAPAVEPQDGSPAPTLPLDPVRPAPAESGADPEPVGDPARWQSGEWRTFLRSRGVKATELLAEARRLGAGDVRNLDDLAGHPEIADELLGWAEDRSLG